MDMMKSNVRRSSALRPALALLAALGGCATAPAPSPASSPAPSPVVQVWENPGAEFPTMCMLMHADGKLAFKGGFQFYSPGTWRQDWPAGQLTITLGGGQPFPADISKEQLRGKTGALVAYNEQRRELTYKVGPATPFLGLGNFYFYRAESCHAS